jgi:uncharacterized membrane protein (DUF106 family)
MSIGVAVSLAVMATLSLVFVYTSSMGPKQVMPSQDTLDELNMKLKKLKRARDAYREKQAKEDIKQNQDEYDKYVSILDE